MTTRLFVMVSKKVQPRQYHSNGAACGLKVEIPTAALANPQGFVDQIRGHMALCEIAVQEELKRLAAGEPQIPTTAHGTIDGRDANPAPAAARRAGPASAIPPPGSAKEIEEDDADEDAPADGRQLFGWARKQDHDMKGWIIAFGRRAKFKGNVIDWNDQQVAKAYAAAKTALADAQAKAR
jgi:hypothetical protein